MTDRIVPVLVVQIWPFSSIISTYHYPWQHIPCVPRLIVCTMKNRVIGILVKFLLMEDLCRSLQGEHKEENKNSGIEKRENSDIEKRESCFIHPILLRVIETIYDLMYK